MLEFTKTLRSQYTKLFPEQHIWIKHLHLTPTEQQNLTRRKLEDLMTGQLSDELSFMKWPAPAPSKQKSYNVDSKIIFKIKVDSYNDRFNMLFKD